MPGPYRAAVGKPPAVRKRPRRGQDPSLRTYPSTGARTPPQVCAATRQRAATHVGGGVPDAPEAFCRRPPPGKPPGRACPAPTARRWASPLPSVNARGGVKTPPYGPPHQRVPRPYSAYVNYIRRAGCPHPAASSRGYPSTGGHPRRGRRPRRPGNLPSPGKLPGRACPAPTARRRASPMPSTNARGGVKTPPYGPTHQRVPGPPTARRCGNGDKKTEAIPFPGTASVLYISI